MKHWRWILCGIVAFTSVVIGLVLGIPLLADFSFLENQPNLQVNLENANEYVVRPGDTLFAISNRFGVTVQAVVTLNQISNPRLIHAGQRLLIPSNTAVQPPLIVSEPLMPQPTEAVPPPVPPAEEAEDENPAASGAIYFVREGDSLFSIANRFQTTIQAIATANQIQNPNLLYNGQRLLIPGDDLAVPLIPEVTTAVSPLKPAPTPAPQPTAVASEFGLIWPNDYRGLYKRFMYGHGAIDIAVPTGSPVLASAAGTVNYAGWHNAGFGYLVILDHENGSQTLYAHNSDLLVAAGQPINQGEQIAVSGSTGNSTHPHIHFSIIENGRLIDPCRRLPGGC